MLPIFIDLLFFLYSDKVKFIILSEVKHFSIIANFCGRIEEVNHRLEASIQKDTTKRNFIYSPWSTILTGEM